MHVFFRKHTDKMRREGRLLEMKGKGWDDGFILFKIKSKQGELYLLFIYSDMQKWNKLNADAKDPPDIYHL